MKLKFYEVALSKL